MAEAIRHNRRTELTVRIGIGVILVAAGFAKLLAPNHMAWILEARGIPDPKVVGMVFAVFEAIAGAVLIAGYRTRQVAFALALIYAPIALVFHSPLGRSWIVARSLVLDFAFDILVVCGLWLLATGKLNKHE